MNTIQVAFITYLYVYRMGMSVLEACKHVCLTYMLVI